MNIFNLAKNAGTSVDQIERFYARNMRIRVVGPVTVEQRRGVVSFTVSGMRSEDVCRRLDAYGLALRHGHHCAQPLMLALGIEGTARASLAPYTTEDDINHLVAALAEIVHSA